MKDFFDANRDVKRLIVWEFVLADSLIFIQVLNLIFVLKDINDTFRFDFVSLGLQLLLVFSLLLELGLRYFQELSLRLRHHLIRESEAGLRIQQVREGYAPQRVKVFVVEEHVAASEQPITAGTPNFLHVVFDAPGQVIVNHRLDVRLIDAH